MQTVNTKACQMHSGRLNAQPQYKNAKNEIKSDRGALNSRPGKRRRVLKLSVEGLDKDMTH